MKILGFGDNIVDRYLDRKVEYPGGNAVNVAVYAHRLGVAASYLGAFGNDDLGTFIRTSIEAEGVRTGHSVVRQGPSGISTLEVLDGDRTFARWNGGGVTVSEPIDLADGRFDYASSFDVVHSSAYSATEAELPKLSTTGPLLSFDFSDEAEHRTGDYLRQVAPHVDLALVSCSDLDVASARDLLGDIVARGAGLALGTRGREGALLTDGQRWFATPAHLVECPSTIVDTMGCGDAFLAGFMVELLHLGWQKGSVLPDVYLNRGLYAGAAASREQCFVESAFGRGRPCGCETEQ